MLTSELIKLLERSLKENGDLPVIVSSDDDFSDPDYYPPPHDITADSIVVAEELHTVQGRREYGKALNIHYI
jgi:hypothetical protein